MPPLPRTVSRGELVRRAAVGSGAVAPELAARGPLAERAREGAGALREVLDVKPARRRRMPVPVAIRGDATTGAVLGLFDAARASADPRSVMLDVFSPTPSEQLAALQVDVVETAFLGALAVALSSDYVEDDPRFGQVLDVALSATHAAGRARELLLGRTAPLDPAPPTRRPRRGDLPGGPGLPDGIPPDLLREGERLARAGCVGKLLVALGAVGRAVADQSPRYRAGAHIDGFAPPSACPGDILTVTGSGFGPAADAGVVFTSVDDRPILVASAQCQSWSDTQIVVVVPAGAGKGPVGVVSIPAAQGATAPATLAADAISEAQTCLGPVAGQRLADVVGKVVGPVLSLPAMQPDRLNYFAGGAPKIHAFGVDRTVIWPNAVVTLRWTVEGATGVQIVPGPQPPGGPAHELPPVPGPLDPSSGSVSVTVPGTHAWEGAYELRASNACTGTQPATARASLRMFLRRGLALGGGGARGDFQVGALRYLYDVKNVRPDAIASTSVGSINAAELVMGDDATGNGAARLEAVWRSLTGNSSMWLEEPWLAAAKADTRQIVRSLSVEGLLSLPYSLAADIKAGIELKEAIERGPAAFFNINPIELLMRARFDATRAENSGIRLRLVCVSLESGEVIQVDERGAIISRETPTAQRSTVIDGAIASSTMPAIFPARRVGDHMCVDGGVRDVIPVQIAVEDLGCNEVYAIRLSASPEPLVFRQNRSLLEVAARSLLDIVFDEVADDDVAPFRGWGDTVKVHVIDATLNVHDPLTIDPGLIDIAIAYGWMRAADVLDTPPTAVRRAREISDEITRLRAENWDNAFRAAGDRLLDRHGSFPILDGAFPTAPSQIRPVPSPEAVDDVRANCLRIRQLVLERIALGAPTPPQATRTGWWTQWERIPGGGPPGTPWDQFTSRVGTRPAVAPPPPA